MKDPNREKFIRNLKVGIPGVESGGGDYTAQNQTSSAAGKHQFTKVWLKGDTSTKTMGITEYAKKHGFGDVATLEDFKADPELQDSYFDYYAGSHLYPKAVELANGKNPLGLSLDSIGAVLHFQGNTSGATQVTSGKLKAKTETNMSVDGYLDVFNKTLGSKAMAPVNKNYSEKEKKEIYSEYIKKRNDIQKDDNISESNKELLLNKLKRDAYENGYVYTDEKGNSAGPLNDVIKKNNEEYEKQYTRNHDNLNSNIQFFNDPELLNDKSISSNGQNITINVKTSEQKERFKKLIETYPELNKNPKTGKKYTQDQINRGVDFKIDLTKDNNVFKKLEGSAKELGYEDYTILESHNDMVFGNPDNKQKFKEGALHTGFRPSGPGVNFTSKNFFNIPKAEGNEFTVERDGVHFVPVDPEWDGQIKEKNAAKQIKENEKVIKKANDNPTPETEESAKAIDYYSDDHFNTVYDAPSSKTYDASQMKNNFPIAEVAGALGGAVLGLTGAKKDTPRRDEKLNDAFVAYTHDLKRISQIGLDPAEEAYAKQMLSESYHAGVENVVRASGGNRNIVLANLGRLDHQHSKGLANVALADAQAKREAMYKYGEAMKYVNEFDANKDIANNERDYKEALLDKEASSELAAAGFTKMLDEIAYYRENGPGSAMSIAKSIYFQDNLGYDPQMKDDGTGKPGTKSAFDMKNAENAKLAGYNKESSDIWQNMTPERKHLVDKFAHTNGFGKQTDQFLRYVNDMEYVDPNQELNMNKMNSAKDGNYGALFEESKSFFSHTNPLSTESAPFENSFEKEENNQIKNSLKEFQPFENPFQPKESMNIGTNPLFDTERYKENNYVNKQ